MSYNNINKYEHFFSLNVSQLTELTNCRIKTCSNVHNKDSWGKGKLTLFEIDHDNV